jgi:AcrR family transcriptional regulator
MVSDHLLFIMTERQEKIIQAALKLFSSDGYTATSTSKVAAEAGVSEGLVFKHFKNKEGLVHAILALGENEVRDLLSSILNQSDPKKVVQEALDLPFRIKESEYDFWRLQYKLKWELGYTNREKMAPVRLALENAFKQLDFDQPKTEAELVLLLIDGVAAALLKGNIFEKERLNRLIQEKYFKVIQKHVTS